ncbi:MBL fold metallo-hydrolase [Sutcliffiella cohnii]|uniref:MBL fold metallo-hydrolase n=1 Tax=Sutcliffiella cohnii TaxID=33932 RepID=UPI002E1AD365|nr:MBL fold metallo-hydrolase [Sutcliffiella cohnii]
MKLTVLGYWGGYPAVNSATSGYLLQKDGFNLLIDCGSGVLSQLQNYLKPNELHAVLISHYHQDHIADIGVLQYARLIQTFLGNELPTLPIYGHREDEQAFSKLTHQKVTTGIAYNPEETLTIGPFSVQFLKTSHPVSCYAMKISSEDSTIVYTADSSYQDSFIPFSTGADFLIAECNLYANQDGKSGGHMNSHDVAKIAQNANVQQLLLTHLPHFGKHDQLLEEATSIYKGNVKLATTGFTWQKGKI